MIKELGFFYIDVDPTVPPGVPGALPNVLAIRNNGSMYLWVGPTDTDWIILPIRQIIDDFSAGGSPLIAEETISGFRAVAITPSGNLQIAMPAVSGRMPAVGIAISGALSGSPCSFWTDGYFQVSSGLVDFSGFIGQPLYVARSGQIGVLSGGVLSGGFASGDMPQRIGSVVNSGGVRVRLDPFTKDAVQSPPGTFWISSGDVASGQISQGHLASGAVNSGQVASGAVIGSVGGGALTIASGTIGPSDLGSGAVLSGTIASGQVGNFAIASGAVTSGRLGVTGAPDGTKFLRDDFTWTTPTAGSGSIGSGAIASGAVQGFFGTTRDIASGTVGVFDFGSGAVVAGTVGSGAVVSGNIASGQIGQNHLASGSVTSGAIASGQVSQFKLSSGAVNSGQLASGAVIGAFGGGALTIASGTIGPSDLGSGAVASGNTASGAVITYARDVITDLFTCSETISGVRCVTIDPAGSGQIRIAMAAVSGRMPAIGVVFENNLSGSACKVVQAGHVVPPSAAMGSGVCISGRIGKSLWVGASGQVVVLSGGGPTIGVGATNSGAWGQRLGTSALSGTVLIQMNPNQQFSGAANITTNPQQWPV
jgi:hypothetical protein